MSLENSKKKKKAVLIHIWIGDENWKKENLKDFSFDLEVQKEKEIKPGAIQSLLSKILCESEEYQKQNLEVLYQKDCKDENPVFVFHFLEFKYNNVDFGFIKKEKIKNEIEKHFYKFINKINIYFSDIEYETNKILNQNYGLMEIYNSIYLKYSELKKDYDFIKEWYLVNGNNLPCTRRLFIDLRNIEAFKGTELLYLTEYPKDSGEIPADLVHFKNLFWKEFKEIKRFEIKRRECPF